MFLFHLSFTGNKFGSLIIDVVLKFTTEVAEHRTIFIIENAIVDGKLGELSRNVSSIIGIPHFPQTTITAPNCSTPESVFADSGTINLRVCHLFASCCFKLDSLSLLSFQTHLNTADW